MRKFVLLALTSVLAVVCLAQGDRVPAYHDHALQPGDAMPILPKDQWWGESFQYPYQVKAMSWRPRFQVCCTRCRVTAIATASGTAACIAASRPPTERIAESA